MSFTEGSAFQERNENKKKLDTSKGTFVTQTNGEVFQCKQYVIVGFWFCFVAMNNKKEILGLQNIEKVMVDGRVVKVF